MQPTTTVGWAWHGLASHESHGQGNSCVQHCSAASGAMHEAALSQAHEITSMWFYLAGSTQLLGSYRVWDWLLTLPSPPIWKLSRQWNLVAYAQSEDCNLLLSVLFAHIFLGDRYKKMRLEELLCDKFRHNPNFYLPEYPLPLDLRTVT